MSHLLLFCLHKCMVTRLFPRHILKFYLDIYHSWNSNILTIHDMKIRRHRAIKLKCAASNKVTRQTKM
jgi:hypothetical protein